jgi:hypothetical protein
MRARSILPAVILLSLAALPVAAQDQQQRDQQQRDQQQQREQQQARDDLANLKSLLLQLKVNPFPPPRERSAQLLAALVRRMDRSVIDRPTIDEMAGYLEDNSDAVRGRVAIALGNIGEPAKHTVPALEKAFVRAKEHIAASQNNPQPAYGYRTYGLGASADNICFALQRLEAPTIPAGCVDGRYEPQVAPSARELER